METIEAGKAAVRAVEPIRFPFDERRALDAAGVLLQHAGGRMKYLRLIKLLYLADRESIDRRGRPIVGGRYVSMNYGPVLSEVLTLIKQGAGEGPWSKAIQKENFEVHLEVQPDGGSISQEEVDLLIEAADLCKTLDEWKICSLTHAFPEWQDPKGSAIDISPEDILRALGRKDEEVEESRQAATERIFFDGLFGR